MRIINDRKKAQGDQSKKWVENVRSGLRAKNMYAPVEEYGPDEYKRRLEAKGGRS